MTFRLTFGQIKRIGKGAEDFAKRGELGCDAASGVPLTILIHSRPTFLLGRE